MVPDWTCASPPSSAEWRQADLAAIHARLARLREYPDGTLFSASAPQHDILVAKLGSQIQLYFSRVDPARGKRRFSGIMSRVDLADPLDLLGAYTQAMMLALAWKCPPERVYLLGWGGGRLPMLLHNWFEDAVIEGSEIDGQVLAISTRYFGLGPSPRLSVVRQDGREHLATMPDDRRYDIVLIDCFVGTGQHPAALATREFYALCKARLQPGGVVATNLLERDPYYAHKVETFAVSFASCLGVRSDGSHVLFGSDGPALAPETLLSRAEMLQDRFTCPFPLAARAADAVPVYPGSVPGPRGRGAVVLTDGDVPADRCGAVVL
jgi:spermidine synthase